MTKYYTGIGSRETPADIIELMHNIAARLARLEFTLRSGGADGADHAFEVGCDIGKGVKEIYLPWKGFNGNKSPLFEIPHEAVTIAAELCGSRWTWMKRPVKQLMSRNCMQVLGMNLDAPSDFVICWTSDGCVNMNQRTRETGGTGQAIALASLRNVPVYNLQRQMDQEMVEELLQQLEATNV